MDILCLYLGRTPLAPAYRALLFPESAVKPPRCKLCKKEHWLTEPHDLSAWSILHPSTPVVPAFSGEVYGPYRPLVEFNGADLVAEAEAEAIVTPIVTPEPAIVTSNRNGGRARVYATPAEKQAAYRKRRKA